MTGRKKRKMMEKRMRKCKEKKGLKEEHEGRRE